MRSGASDAGTRRTSLGVLGTFGASGWLLRTSWALSALGADGLLWLKLLQEVAAKLKGAFANLGHNAYDCQEQHLDQAR